MRITSRLEKNSELDLRPRTADHGYKLFVGRSAVTITLNHFSAALVFSLFASIVYGIPHRENTRDMVRYGLYCFAMFLGGVFVAGWAMWVLRR